MIPPACCEPIQSEEWREVEPWNDEREPGIAKHVEHKLGFIDWCVQEGLISYEESPETVEVTLGERFREQADKWGRETEHLSSPTQRMMHPSYQAILGMAQDSKQDVIRLMLRDLRDHRRPWFWALSYLTQDNPIHPRDAGKMDKMIEAWVNWGKAEGVI